MPDECGCEDRCRYRPEAVKAVLAYVADHGVDALASIMTPSQGYDRDRVAGFGPSEPTWHLYVADLTRAQQAGCSTPEQIAMFLCPFALESGKSSEGEAA